MCRITAGSRWILTFTISTCVRVFPDTWAAAGAMSLVCSASGFTLSLPVLQPSRKRTGPYKQQPIAIASTVDLPAEFGQSHAKIQPGSGRGTNPETATGYQHLRSDLCTFFSVLRSAHRGPIGWMDTMAEIRAFHKRVIRGFTARAEPGGRAVLTVFDHLAHAGQYVGLRTELG